jgi:hypothetical protein
LTQAAAGRLPRHHLRRVCGTGGGAALRNVEGSFYDFIAERYGGTTRETLAEPPDAWGGRAAADWATRLAAGEQFSADAERLVDVAHVLDRIYGRERVDGFGAASKYETE